MDSVIFPCHQMTSLGDCRSLSRYVSAVRKCRGRERRLWRKGQERDNAHCPLSPHLQDGDIDGVHAPSLRTMRITHMPLRIRILPLYQHSHWMHPLPSAPIPALFSSFPTHMTRDSCGRSIRDPHINYCTYFVFGQSDVFTATRRESMDATDSDYQDESRCFVYVLLCEWRGDPRALPEPYSVGGQVT